MTAIPDARRWVALRAHGAMRLLGWVQAALEDVEGALADGQDGVAAVQARSVVLQCLAIRSLGRGGEVDFDLDSPSFDPFEALAPQEVVEGLALAARAVDPDELEAGAWLGDLRAYVAETERLLGYDEPLPVLRSPEGTFALLSLTRRWAPVLSELGLPPLLPGEWRPSPAGRR